MNKAQIIRSFAPGQRVTVTNHYITRLDHPCYGTQVRTIEKVNSSALFFAVSGRVPWPKADQLEAEGTTVRLYGGGAGQQPHELFLTITAEAQDDDNNPGQATKGGE